MNVVLEDEGLVARADSDVIGLEPSSGHAVASLVNDDLLIEDCVMESF